MNILKEGSAGNEVFLLQQRLKIMNFFPETITGSYGYETKEAVKRFQKSNNLLQTGVVDNQTWKILENLASKPLYPQSKSIINKPVIRYGDNNSYVRELQEQLKELMYYDGQVTGYFGDETLNAVKAFQLNNKLSADGIVGRDTWNALTYLYSPLATCGNNNGNNNNYIVQKGDSLWSIANKYGVSINSLKEANNLTSDLIYPGQSLVIPNNTSNTTSYTIKKGDSLWSIANRYGTTIQAIKLANNLTSDIIYTGQTLIIPLQ